MSKSRLKPFNASGRQSASIAYACYLFIAAATLVAGAITFAYQPPLSSQEFGAFQSLLMVVVMPLAILSALAGVLGVATSLSALSYQPVEWGLAVLAVLLLALVIALASEPESSGEASSVVAAAFVVSALGLSVRWFVVTRKRLQA